MRIFTAALSASAEAMGMEEQAGPANCEKSSSASVGPMIPQIKKQKLREFISDLRECFQCASQKSSH